MYSHATSTRQTVCRQYEHHTHATPTGVILYVILGAISHAIGGGHAHGGEEDELALPPKQRRSSAVQGTVLLVQDGAEYSALGEGATIAAATTTSVLCQLLLSLLLVVRL
jgi:hypothetical protein